MNRLSRAAAGVAAPLALSGLSALSVIASPPTAARAEQFVLFDVTLTYTKADADNSRPSKSHYYVVGDAINPKRPRDWTRPVDYRNGTVHIRTEVLDRPASGEGTQWSLCYIPNKGQGNGYGCTGTPTYTEKGVYEKDVPMTAFWENDAIVWSEGIKQMDLVIKDRTGTKIHARPDPEKFVPTRVRITMVQVSAGAKYDPALVPGIAPTKPAPTVAPAAPAAAPKTSGVRRRAGIAWCALGGLLCVACGTRPAPGGGGRRRRPPRLKTGTVRRERRRCRPDPAATGSHPTPRRCPRPARAGTPR